MTQEIVKLGTTTPVEREPHILFGEENQVEEVETSYAEMTSYQLYRLLLEGKLPPSAVPLYFQKQKQEDLDRATGALYKRSQPINSVECNFWKEITAQHARILAQDYSDPQKIAREVAAIEARYEPLINGTPQDHARYFANKAISISLNNASIKRERSVEEINRTNSNVANLYGLASQLSREVVVEQAAPAGKSTAVVAAAKPAGQPA